jgi:SpoVK/Ycf46/Vps4 family AAA+-type ATPase
MEGVVDYKKVVVLAATNKPWNLDPAVERRFALKLFIDIPDELTRKGIILQKLREKFKIGKSEDPLKLIEDFGHPQYHLKDSDIDIIVALTGTNKIVIDASENIETKNTKYPWKIPDVSWFPNSRKLYGKEIKLPDRVKKLFKVTESQIEPKSRYGYSSSDLGKMMNKAFNNAAKRALKSPLKETQVRGGYYFIPVFDPNTKDVRFHEIPTPEELILSGFAESSLDNATALTSDLYGRISTYDIRLEDVILGMNLYPSTINATDYAGYLYYVKYNEPPPEFKSVAE